ncbi:MAG TPA: metallophosphoesterase [Candidatus Binatia bacterium]|jgi:DNA repair exonuclease SbcCD nuclease subunit
MTKDTNRRDFLRLAGIGGVVFASALGATAAGAATKRGRGGYAARAKSDFYFVQLSDTHIGFEGPAVNPDAAGTLEKAIATVNALDEQPDFVVFTGDLTHTTDDASQRRERMKRFQGIAGTLRAKSVHFMAGEHDAAPDRGDVYQSFFGALHYTFDHKGVHFIVLDNVSDPGAIIGDAQLTWLQHDLARLKHDHPIVVLTHRPLFDLYPEWDWATRDAAATIAALEPFSNVTVFYGHIHQEHHHMTGHIAHHSAKSLIFALPAPGSVPKKAPIPWDASEPYRGLGARDVEAEVARADYELTELPVVRAGRS